MLNEVVFENDRSLRKRAYAEINLGSVLHFVNNQQKDSCKATGKPYEEVTTI